jgi:hypothetical protein
LVFGDLNVFENLRVAAERQSGWSFLNDIIRPNRSRDLSPVEYAIDALGLRPFASSMPNELSIGQVACSSLARGSARRSSP